MSEVRIEEIRRLAQSAQNDAREARHVGDQARSEVAAHEKLCSERYGSINRQLLDLKSTTDEGARDQKLTNGKIYDAIHRVEVALAGQGAAAVTKVSTTDYMMRWGGLVAGIVGVCYGIIK